MSEFYGNMEAKVDAKGRIIVPARYRKSLEQENDSALYLERDAAFNCIKVYPHAFWRKKVEKYESTLNMDDEDDERLHRQMMSRVEYVEMDASGKILIPKLHLTKCKIDTDSRIIGRGYYFEIWDDAVLNEESYTDEEYKKVKQEKMGNKTVRQLTINN